MTETNTQEIEQEIEKAPKKQKKQPKKRLSKTQKLQIEVDEFKDKYIRLHAEFENSNKRRDRETEKMLRRSKEYTLLSFLPVLDDLERTLKYSEEHDAVETFIEGLNIIRKKLEKVFKENGVKVIESVGKTFNPELHEAMMVEDAPDSEANSVLDEFEKGYTVNDKVLRPAKVKVSKS